MPLVLFLEIEIVQVYQYPQWMFHGTPAQWNMMRWPRKSYFPRPNKFEKLCGLYLPLLVKQSILKVPGNATVKGIFFLFNSVFPTFSWPWSLPLPHSDVTRGTSFLEYKFGQLRKSEGSVSAVTGTHQGEQKNEAISSTLACAMWRLESWVPKTLLGEGNISTLSASCMQGYWGGEGTGEPERPPLLSHLE